MIVLSRNLWLKMYVIPFLLPLSMVILHLELELVWNEAFSETERVIVTAGKGVRQSPFTINHCPDAF